MRLDSFQEVKNQFWVKTFELTLMNIKLLSSSMSLTILDQIKTMCNKHLRVRRFHTDIPRQFPLPADAQTPQAKAGLSFETRHTSVKLVALRRLREFIEQQEVASRCQGCLSQRASCDLGTAWKGIGLVCLLMYTCAHADTMEESLQRP